MTPGQAPDPQHRLTMLLRRMTHGDREAGEEAVAQVYSELRRLACKALSGGSGSMSLQPTLLVNEAFLRLLRGEPIEWQDRRHFYILSARMMRRIVVDHFRERNAQKRPPSRGRVALEDVVVISEERRDEVLIVDEALRKLEEFDARAAQVVELRYFGGLSEEETAEVLAISVRTFRRDRAAAQYLLKQYLQRAETNEP
jgi:RNA polymerase sigma-70 factor, ECF subfamily